MTSQNLTPVENPAIPVAPYMGGKCNLSKRICTIIDKTPHKTYAEPFVGMGGIFLKRKKRPRVEVINDYGRDVANLFRILQRHYPQFLEVVRFQLTVRAEFNRLADTNPDTLTDLERAARFLYLQSIAFGGRTYSRSFGVSTEHPARFNLSRLEPMLENLHARLSGVSIECLDYAAFIERYDRAYTLFYLDPPYWNCEKDYGKNLFSKDDFAVMAKQLAGIKGKFIMSINDVPEIRDLFGQFYIDEVNTTYTIGSKNAAGKCGRVELLISNFKLPLKCN